MSTKKQTLSTVISNVLLLCAFIFTAPSLFAGSFTHGGGGLICQVELGGFTVELLDFFEARDVWKFHLLHSNPPGPGAAETPTINQKALELARSVIEKIRPLDEQRADEYIKKLNVFFENTKFVKDRMFVSSFDFSLVAIPYQCQMAQIAVQLPDYNIPDRFASDKLYTISYDLWRLMDIPNKAGLIVHEIIYSEALLKGHQTSRKARYFNALLFSEEFSKLNDESYQALLREIYFLPFIRVGDISLFDPNSFDLYPNGAFFRGTLKKEMTINVPNIDTPMTISENSSVMYYPNGSIKSTRIAKPKIVYEGKCDYDTGIGVLFYSTGQLMSIQHNKPTMEICIPMQDGSWTQKLLLKPKECEGPPFNYKSAGCFSFHKSGVVMSALNADEGQLYRLPNREPFKFLADSEIIFHPSGFIAKAELAEDAVFNEPLEKITCFKAAILELDEHGQFKSCSRFSRKPSVD